MNAKSRVTRLSGNTVLSLTYNIYAVNACEIDSAMRWGTRYLLDYLFSRDTTVPTTVLVLPLRRCTAAPLAHVSTCNRLVQGAGLLHLASISNRTMRCSRVQPSPSLLLCS
jgi:hypothetical protein